MGTDAAAAAETTYSFRVGEIECLAIKDGDWIYHATEYAANAPVEEAERALAEYGHDPQNIPSPYSGLLVRSSSRLVLIDTGAGDLTPRVGKLLVNLRSAGVDPAAIDTVVLTHGHPDHIGGNVDADGKLAFPDARHVMFRDEWDHWTDETKLAQHPEVMRESARRNLLPLRDQVELLDREIEIAPGVEAIDSPGHTAGHLAVAIRSGGEELLYISDAALHPIHLDHPEWHPMWDLDPTQAMDSRRALMDRAATEHSLVLAFHFPPFPSLGRVTRAGHGWRWEPV